MARLNTAAADRVLEELNETFRSALALVDAQEFDEARGLLDIARGQLKAAVSSNGSPDEPFLNDAYVLDGYVDFFFDYTLLWERIATGKFSASWVSLQNALDLLRILKKFSSIYIGFFENQLTELEKIYPYTFFFSIGATVGRFECSICGGDIDSPNCPHMRGMLYGGAMACAMMRDVVAMDHVSMVTNPQDKRCVPNYEDDSDRFHFVRFLGSTIRSGKSRILSFHHIERSVKKIPRSEFPRLGRNDQCFCGSKMKYKKCCLRLDETESNHTELMCRAAVAVDAIPAKE